MSSHCLLGIKQAALVSYFDEVFLFGVLCNHGLIYYLRVLAGSVRVC